jgi:hypothetical protein
MAISSLKQLLSQPKYVRKSQAGREQMIERQ